MCLSFSFLFGKGLLVFGEEISLESFLLFALKPSSLKASLAVYLLLRQGLFFKAARLFLGSPLGILLCEGLLAFQLLSVKTSLALCFLLGAGILFSVETSLALEVFSLALKTFGL